MGAEFSSLLAVIQHTSDVAPTLDRLRRLGFSSTPLHAVRVVYERLADLDSRHIGGTENLQAYVLEAEEAYLEKALKGIADDFTQLSAATTWHSRQWEGVLEVAKDRAVDFLIKVAHEDEHTLFLQAPDDWNLLRHSTVPVLLASSAQWQDSPGIAVAIDVHDQAHGELNQRVLAVADEFKNRLNASMHIVSAVPSVDVLMDHGFTDPDKLRRDLEAETCALIDEFCEAHRVTGYTPHVVSGATGPRLSEFCREQSADLMILGTKARKGLRGLVLGNTCENILSHAQVDVLTVPMGGE